MQQVNILQNHRHEGETFANYKARRRAVNLGLKRKARGQMFHLSAEILRLPLPRVDEKCDTGIARGLIRHVSDPIFLPDGTGFRVGVVKGTTYRRTEPKIRHGQGRIRRAAGNTHTLQYQGASHGTFDTGIAAPQNLPKEPQA